MVNTISNLIKNVWYCVRKISNTISIKYITIYPTVCPEKVVQRTFLSVSLTQIVILKLSLYICIVLLSYFSNLPYFAILLVYWLWKVNLFINLLGSLYSLWNGADNDIPLKVFISKPNSWQ